MNPTRLLPFTLATLLVAGTAAAQSDEPSALVNASSANLIGPAVQPLGPGHVVVVWENGAATVPARVSLTSPGRPDAAADVTAVGEILSAEFEGLEPGVEYSYTIDGRSGRFIVPPGPDQELRFAVFGDSRTGDNVHRQIVERLVELRPDFYLTTGDDVTDGEQLGQWRHFFEIERPLTSTTAFAGVQGNHDVGGMYHRLKRLPGANKAAGDTCGGLDVGPAHFVMIDTESDVTAGSPQYAFIEQDLAANQGKPLFAVLHKPLFSSGYHGGAREPEIGASLGPLFQRYGVDVVFQGHDHHYERTQPINGVTYVVTGGAGAFLRGVSGATWTEVAESVNHYLVVEASATRIRVTAKRLDGSRLDSFEVDPRANDGQFTGNETLPPGGGCGCAVPGLSSESSAPGRTIPALGAVAGAVGMIAARARRRRRAANRR